MVINIGHSICWDINPMLVHLFINKYLLAFINQHINPNKIQITMLNIMQLDVTTTQTLLEAGIFGFPRRAKPSAAA